MATRAFGRRDPGNPPLSACAETGIPGKAFAPFRTNTHRLCYCASQDSRSRRGGLLPSGPPRADPQSTAPGQACRLLLHRDRDVAQLPLCTGAQRSASLSRQWSLLHARPRALPAAAPAFSSRLPKPDALLYADPRRRGTADHGRRTAGAGRRDRQLQGRWRDRGRQSGESDLTGGRSRRQVVAGRR